MSDLPVGEVRGPTPPAGSVLSKGSQVSVFTSDGSLPITMPNEVGKSRQAAVTDLQSAGFMASHITYVWTASPPGSVCTVSQTSPTPSSSTSSQTLRQSAGGGVAVFGRTDISAIIRSIADIRRFAERRCSAVELQEKSADVC